MTPNPVREREPSVQDAVQCLMVSGSSRSERACDYHTLFERIGVGARHPYGV